jgi:multidrug/hemolysin transport system permease protein
MNNLRSLIKRDIRIFYRTKGNIFFALLSVIILLTLHFIIFRDMYTDNWVDITAQIPGFSVEREKLLWLVDNLMFSAIIPIGAITISLVTLGLMVADRETNVLADFLVAPIRRDSLLTSYLISSFIVGFIILLGFIGGFEIFFLLVYGFGFSLAQICPVLLTTIGSLVFANVFMLLTVSFVKSQQSLGAVGTIIGTLMGFISGAYIPIGMFGETVGNIFGALPFLQITVLSRWAFLYELEAATPLTKAMLSGEIARSFGMEMWIGDTHVPLWGVALIASGITMLLLVCLIIRFSKMRKEE